MALINENEIIYKTNVTEVEIEAPENESYLVKAIGVSGLSSECWMEVVAERTSVGYFPLYFAGMEPLKFWGAESTKRNLLMELAKLGFPITYPIPARRKLTLKFSATVPKLLILYDRYEEGDVKREDINGDMSDTLRWINWLTNEDAISSSGDVQLDDMFNPPEHPNFPLEVCPAEAEIDLKAVMALALATSKGDGSSSLGTSYTKFLKLVKERKVLFDVYRNGLPVLGKSDYEVTSTTQSYDYTQVFNVCPVELEYNAEMFFLKTPIGFKGGEELTVVMNNSVDSDAPIGANKLLVGLLMEMRYGRG